MNYSNFGQTYSGWSGYQIVYIWSLFMQYWTVLVATSILWLSLFMPLVLVCCHSDTPLLADFD